MTPEDILAHARRNGLAVPTGLRVAGDSRGKATQVAGGTETRRRRDVEHQEQVKIIQWAELYKSKWPQLGFLAAVPNGGHRHLSVAKKLKAEGVRSGYPDLVLNVPSGKYHGLFIELKAPKGRPTESQKEWLVNLMRAGNAALVCYGADEAIKALSWYCSGANAEIELIGENK
jgi:hypothetical protein